MRAADMIPSEPYADNLRSVTISHNDLCNFMYIVSGNDSPPPPIQSLLTVAAA